MAEPKQVDLFLSAVKDDNGVITLDVYDTAGNIVKAAVAKPGSTITWSIKDDSIQYIDRIYKDVESQNVFSTKPYPKTDDKTQWIGVVDENSNGSEAYTVNFIYEDGNQIWVDPIVEVDPGD